MHPGLAPGSPLAIKARTQASNQIAGLIVTAPDELRSKLRELDTDRRVDDASLRTAAAVVGTWPIALSRMERGVIHDAQLAARYLEWLNQTEAA